MKINLLSSKIYNRIAAGEVVERPFSVVKELVENSIDAGATEVEIEIENGGISLIKITDNGFGIEKSELKKALLPYATSKISSITDLDNICSLGFRGFISKKYCFLCFYQSSFLYHLCNKIFSFFVSIIIYLSKSPCCA